MNERTSERPNAQGTSGADPEILKGLAPNRFWVSRSKLCTSRDDIQPKAKTNSKSGGTPPPPLDPPLRLNEQTNRTNASQCVKEVNGCKEETVYNSVSEFYYFKYIFMPLTKQSKASQNSICFCFSTTYLQYFFSSSSVVYIWYYLQFFCIMYKGCFQI